MDFSQSPKKYLTSLYLSLKKVLNIDINLQSIHKAWETASRHTEQLTIGLEGKICQGIPAGSRVFQWFYWGGPMSFYPGN